MFHNIYCILYFQNRQNQIDKILYSCIIKLNRKIFLNWIILNENIILFDFMENYMRMTSPQGRRILKDYYIFNLFKCFVIYRFNQM